MTKHEKSLHQSFGESHGCRLSADFAAKTV